MAESEGIFLADGENIADVSPYEFDSVVEEAGNSFTLDAAAAIHGGKGYKLSFGGLNSLVYGYKSWAVQTDIYIRQYINPISWVEVSGIDRLTWSLAHEGGSVRMYLNFYLLSGTNHIGATLFFKHNGGTLTAWDQHLVHIFTVGTPFFIEGRYKSGVLGVGGYSFYINGVLISSDYTTYATDAYSIDGLRCGVMGVDVAPDAATVFYVDDVKTDTVLIGEYGKGPYRSNIIYAALIKRKQGRRISRR